jgi:hypothetical protein
MCRKLLIEPAPYAYLHVYARSSRPFQELANGLRGDYSHI